MPTLKIGGQDVTVSDDFLSLTPDKQNAAVEEIAKSLAAKQPGSPIAEFFKSIPTGVANMATAFARGEQIESEQRASVFAQPGTAPLPEIPTGKAAIKAFGLHDPQGLAGSAGELTGELAINPATYMGPGGALSKILSTGGMILGGAAGKEVGKGTPLEPVTEALGMLVGRGGVAGTQRALAAATSPKTVMAADLARAIERDGDTPQAVLARLGEARKIRPEATIADVGGENVRGLTERVAQTPGAGRSIVIPALTERQEEQLGRVSGDLSSLLGTQQSARQAVSEAMAARADAAAPLYETAYREGDQVIWSPTLEQLASSETVKDAMQGAVKAWRDNQVAEGVGAMNPGAAVMGGNLAFLKGKVPVFPNLQFWDYVKRQLDDTARSAIIGGQAQKSRTVTKLAEQLRNALDEAVPSYKSAREAWAGPSGYIESIELGRSILSRSQSAEEMAANFAALSDAGKEGYRIGALSAIKGQMAADPAKLADLTKYLRSPAMREKIAAIMPTPEAADSWRNRLSYEISSSEMTVQALRGSQTARRLAEREDADSLVGDLVKDAILDGPTGRFWWKALMAVPNKIRDTLRSRSDKLLAQQLVLPQTGAATQGALRGPGLPSVNPLPGIAAGAPAVTADWVQNYVGNSSLPDILRQARP